MTGWDEKGRRGREGEERYRFWVCSSEGLKVRMCARSVWEVEGEVMLGGLVRGVRGQKGCVNASKDVRRGKKSATGKCDRLCCVLR